MRRTWDAPAPEGLRSKRRLRLLKYAAKKGYGDKARDVKRSIHVSTSWLCIF